MQVQSLGLEDPLEEGMATHSSVLAWRTPWTEKPGRLQSIGSQRIRHHSQMHHSNSGCYCVSPASTLSARWDLGCPGHPVSDSEVLRLGGGGGIAITSI